MASPTRSQLAQGGYHRADEWRSCWSERPIPKEIPGETTQERAATTPNYLAAQVRLSFPTAAVAQMVESGDLPLRGPQRRSATVHAFLTEHQGKFEIGVQPVEQYIARNNVQVARTGDGRRRSSGCSASTRSRPATRR